MNDPNDLKNSWRRIFLKCWEHKILIIATALILLFALLYKLYHSYKLEHSFKIQPVSVSAAVVTEKAITVPFKAIGTVAAYEAVSIKSQASGQITKVGFARGQIVQKD